TLSSHARVENIGVDWGQIVAEAGAAEPAVILLTHFLPDELIRFYRAFLASELKAQVAVIYGPSITKFQTEFREQANGVIWSTTSGTYSDLLGNRFRDSFRRRFGRFPGWSQAGASYDQVQLLTRAWQTTNTFDYKSTNRALRHLV